MTSDFGHIATAKGGLANGLEGSQAMYTLGIVAACW